MLHVNARQHIQCTAYREYDYIAPRILLRLHSFLSIIHDCILAPVITQTQFNNTLAHSIPLLSLHVPTNHLSSIFTNLHCSSYPLLPIYVYLNFANHTISDHIESYPITAGRGSTCGIQSSALKQLRAILEKDTHITATGAHYACHCDCLPMSVRMH